MLARIVLSIVVLGSLAANCEAQSRLDMRLLGNSANRRFFQPNGFYDPYGQQGQFANPNPAINAPSQFPSGRLFGSPFSGGRNLYSASNNPSLSSIPDMFGDFFGGQHPGGPGQNGLPPRGGAGTRQIKLSENLSAIPRTRTFFSYHFFNDVLDGSFGDVNRYAFGFEIANRAGTASIDIRLPIAHTLSSEQINFAPPVKDNEIGNANIILKKVLASCPHSLFSGGLGIAIPTADDGTLIDQGNNEVLRVRNEAVHLIPFVGFVSEHGPRFFSQGFVQVDLDPGGNEVVGNIPGFPPSQRLGVIHDPTLLFVDLGFGYRFYQDQSAKGLTSVSGAVEIHYATTLQDADVLNVAGFTVGEVTRRFDILNLTVGTDWSFGSITLRPGVVVPLRELSDRQFDYEMFFQVNNYY